MSTFMHDLRHALRGLRKDLGFAATAVAIITIGLGATTSIFSVIEGVLLDPLPVDDPDRSIGATTSHKSTATPSASQSPVTAANF